MISTTFTNNFAEGLQKLSDALGENALRSAGYAGAVLLQNEMLARVPVKTGVIYANVLIKRATERCDTNKKQVFLATVRYGVRDENGDAYYWRWVEDGHKFVRRRKKKRAPGIVISRKTKMETIKSARMHSEIEYGTVKKGARPFMRPAWDAQKNAVLDAVRDRLREKIAEALG